MISLGKEYNNDYIFVVYIFNFILISCNNTKVIFHAINKFYRANLDIFPI